MTVLKGDISAQERESSLSDARYKTLYGRSLAAAVTTSWDGKIIECNEAFVRMLGYDSREELLQQNALSIYVRPEDHQQFLDDLDQTGSLTNYEFKLRKKNGQVIWVQANFYIVEDAQERQIEGSLIEITDRKGHQKKLEEGRENFKYLIEFSPDGVMLLVEGHVKYANPSGQKILGLKEHGLVKDLYFVDLVEEKYKQVVIDRLTKAAKERELPKEEVLVRRLDGRVIDIEMKAIGFSYKGKQAVQLLFRDITEIKKSETELKQSEERYKAIYDQAYIGIVKMDISGHFLQANQQFCQMLGYNDEELRDITIFDITHPDDRQMSKDLFFALQNKEVERISLEKKYLHKGGAVVKSNITSVLVCDNQNKPDYFVTVTEDITERKIAEQKLKASLKEKEVLLKEVHHRVKNNLQVISSILNLQSSYVKDQKTLEMLNESQNRIKSMAFIHESLYQTKDFANINFSDYIVNLSKNLVHSYRVYGDLVEMQYEVEEVLLNLDQAIPCGLIINELVSNALKYAFPEQRRGTIKLELSEQDKWVTLVVSDNGIGLPSDFDYLDTETLGLQLVTTLIKQLSGEISLVTESGTRFEITFKQQNKY